METLVLNKFFVFWSSVTLICTVPCIAHYWWKVRKAEIDAALKHEMVQRGLGAEEIVAILEATPNRKRSAARCW